MKKTKQVRTTFASYTIKDYIGEGGAGVVYRAETEDGALVAIKVLDPDKATPEKRKRFKNEYTFCSRNKHPNIITVSDHGLTEENAPFFVMPLYSGSIRGLVGKLSPIQAFEVFQKILNGLDAAHKLGTTHRDLKPENILANGNGADKDVVIADFGIAEFEKDDIYTAVETKDGTRLANFQYAAPEQKAKGKKIDKRADIYALGLILNELFTNELAHGTGYKTIKSISEEYSYLDLIVERMLHQNPASRYDAVDELKKELIARGVEHVSMQKLSILNATVISVSDIDDPLAVEPMKIVNVDWDNDHLTIRLNHQPTAAWIFAFRDMENYTSLLGKGPDNVNFGGDFGGGFAKILASKDEVQPVIDHFKQWLSMAHTLYVKRSKKKLEQDESKQREELQRKIKQEQERAEVMRSIKY